MRYWILILSILCLACSKSKNSNGGDPGDPPVEEKPKVKVMTYNIYGARASSGTPADLDMIAEVIKSENPDLVALQEVDAFTTRTGKDVHQARDLAKLTGMEWYFTKAMDLQGGEYGDAVLSKFPIKNATRYSLPVASGVGGETRSVALITVEKEGKEFHFASTHLDHLALEDNRILQANELKKIITSLQLPIIIAGDLNAKPESETMSIIKQYLTTGCIKQCPNTFPSDNPDRTIDYILYTPINKFSVQSYNSPNGYVASQSAYASDHRPVVAIFTLN
ncbi:endonuclease [Chitinophaga caeni]|uniref:Endonuclease n=1 Tax=Chitinophaga caeni TaxID=2029983 RepID=A0A291QSY5_9BACT|nr:endonuclease/exonuclease/phosphatase family protein [Chitinophaga caeni]ATL46982.1 endonuclease [Chitinophaga caeni]